MARSDHSRDHTLLMGSDAPPEYYQQPQGLYVSLSVAPPAINCDQAA